MIRAPRQEERLITDSAIAAAWTVVGLATGFFSLNFGGGRLIITMVFGLTGVSFCALLALRASEIIGHIGGVR